ncbi:MAG: hypothetical protein ACYDEA_09430, partial [Candidatus Dormibacteria bacterium]
MLTPRPVAAVATVGLAVVAAGLWAAPVLATNPPPCISQGCSAPANTATIGAAATMPGLPPTIRHGGGGGGWIGGRG